MRPLLAVLFAATLAAPVLAQSKPAAPAPQNRSPHKPPPTTKPATQPRTAARTAPDPIRLRGFGTLGAITFQAQDSFEAILGTRTGLSFGGGAQVILPAGFYAEVGVWHFTHTGERAFVGPNQEVFPLGIPLEVGITPIEITGGWRYRHCPPPPGPPRAPQPPPSPQAPRTPQQPAPRTQAARSSAVSCDPKFIPYVGGGFSSYKYSETSEGDDSSENLDERFNGFHLLGGGEYRVMRWLRIGGEIVWSSVPDALGSGGVSAAFNEDNLGGTGFRVKVTVGR